MKLKRSILEDAKKMKFDTDEEEDAEDSSGGDAGSAIITFGPIEVPREKLLSDLHWLHDLSHATDFETAITVSWHRINSKKDMEKLSNLVSLARLSQDGRSKPPFDFVLEYGSISGAPPTISSGPSL